MILWFVNSNSINPYFSQLVIVSMTHTADTISVFHILHLIGAILIRLKNKIIGSFLC